MAVRLRSVRRRRLALVGIGVLLLLASLSIEYGLAFSAAVLVVGLVARRDVRRPLVAVVLVSAAAYAGLRLGAAGGSFGDYCESMGYFRIERPDPTCLSSLSTEVRIKQHVYNVGASLVGIVLPSLFSFDGVWAPYANPRYKVVVGLILFGLAFLALVRRPRATFPLLTLWLANALLAFYLYRSRNQVVGMLGIYASAGIGAAEAVRVMRAGLLRTRVAAVGAALLVAAGWAAFSGFQAADRWGDVRGREDARDPCFALVRYPKDASRRVVVKIKRKYGMSDPQCTGGSS
jgi:hypothetical protein